VGQDCSPRPPTTSHERLVSASTSAQPAFMAPPLTNICIGNATLARPHAFPSMLPTDAVLFAPDSLVGVVPGAGSS
jgi:hypothetical protein